jgi:hypothetical protein
MCGWDATGVATRTMQSVIYYAMEHVSGSKRCDYAMFQFKNNDVSLVICPAKIINFVCYGTTPGIPTPHFVDSMGHGLQEICTMTQMDHHLYAVVHTAKKISFL